MKHLLPGENKYVRVVLFAILFMIIPQWFEWVIPKIVPATFWVEYEQLVVVDNIVTTDGTIGVFSFAEIKRPAKVEWNDILYCNRGDGFEFVKSQQAEKIYTKRTRLPRTMVNETTGVVSDIAWRFDVSDVTLEVNEKCFIVSRVSVNGKKPYEVPSNIFTIQ